MKNKKIIIALSIVAVLAAAFIALYAYMHHPRTVEFTVEAAEETTGETRTVTTELTLTRTIFGNKRLRGTMAFGDVTFYLKLNGGAGDTMRIIEVYTEKPGDVRDSKYKNYNGNNGSTQPCGMLYLDTGVDYVNGFHVTLDRNEDGYCHYTERETTEMWDAGMQSLSANVIAAIEDIIY